MKDQITITQLPDHNEGGYPMQNFQIVVRRFGIRKVATDHKMFHATRLAYDLWIQIGHEADEK